jgi:multiple sugar transport system substrate-binding protein
MFPSKVFSTRSAQISLSLTLLFLFGCSEPKEPTPAANQAPSAASAPVKLTVQVAGDEELAEGVRLLRGEWKAHGGGELDVEAVDLKSFPGPSEIAADVLVFPSRLLGALVEQKQLRPVRSSLLENPQFALHEIFPALRNGEMKYGGETWALPLGSPPLLMMLNVAAEDEEKKSGPLRTLDRFRKYLSLDAAVGRHAAIPLAGRDAACSLIARALAYTEVQRRHEALFDPTSMKPRITDPPFIRALHELHETVGDVAKAPADFAAAVALLHKGQAAAAFGWPGLLRNAESVSPSPGFSTIVAPFPSSEQVYVASAGRWENQIFSQPVTLLGAEGRLVSVTTASRNAVSAFKLIQWFTVGDPAVQLSSRSHGAIWFRSSQGPAYRRWLKGEVISGPQSLPLDKLISTALATETPQLIPRVPGIDDYLIALGGSIQAAKPGEAGAKAALTTAATAWDAITDRLGRQQQAAAYRRHLGIESFQDAKQ